MVEIELLIQRSDQFRSNKIIKGFFLVYLGFTFFVVWVNVFLVKEVKPSRLYFEWVEGGKNNFLKPKFKKLIKYYILLFCFINSRGGHCPPRSSNSSVPGRWCYQPSYQLPSIDQVSTLSHFPWYLGRENAFAYLRKFTPYKHIFICFHRWWGIP